MTTVKEQPFSVYAPLEINKSQIESTEDGELILEGVASTTSQDLEGDIITSEAIASMKKQAIQCNIRLSHWNGPNGDFVDIVVGKVIEVLDSSKNELKIKFKILKSYAAKIREYVEAGINLGLSIGAKITKYERVTNSENKTSFLKILDVLLIEITLTSLPVNWDTYGTVTTSKGLVKSNCFAGACYQIFKNSKEEVDNMANENNENDNSLSDSDLEKIKNMLNEGLNAQTDVIANKVQSNLEPKLKTIVNEVLAENNNEGNSDKSQGNEPENNDGGSNDSFDLEKTVKTISEEVTKNVTESVKKSIFEDLNKNRQPEGSDNNSQGGENNSQNNENNPDANKTADHLGLVAESPEEIAKSYNPANKNPFEKIFNL